MVKENLKDKMKHNIKLPPFFASSVSLICL